MTPSKIILACLCAVLLAGCVNDRRSRDLDNPTLAPEVTAAQVCSNCHGRSGNSTSPNFPRLAGQQAAYLEAQLKAFRNHQRSDLAGSEYMWGLSKNLSDEQIKGLAEYYAKQVPASNNVDDSGEAALGKTIFENGIPAKETPACQSCHGPKGEGMATFPRLASQHSAYLEK
ncbi:MAG: cytochrome c4, partial [Burkholderiaceae bacterium]|nr:cytochrome c4 [Burkholderiaceae bacterium]